MLTLTSVIEKSTSGILPGVYRYTYVLNNPLKYTDPSGYEYRYSRIEENMAWHEGAQMYYDMMNIMNGYYDRYGTNGGGSGGLSASFQNTVAWGHIYHTIGTLDTQFGGSHNFGTGKTTQYGSNNEAWQEGYRDKYGDYPGMTWGQFTSAFSSSSSSSGRALAQFHGFNGHFFHYDKSTGDFYVPYTDNVINPVDVLSGRINWFGIVVQTGEGIGDQDGYNPDIQGGLWALNAGFGWGGGWHFELGRIRDNHGGKKWFFTSGPTLGVDLTAGIQQRNIYSNSDFTVDMYDGYASSRDLGILCFDWNITGGDSYIDWYQLDFGETYTENGWGISLGSSLGFLWNMDNTTLFGR